MFCALLDHGAPGDARGIWSRRSSSTASRRAGLRRQHGGRRHAADRPRRRRRRDHRLRAALRAARPPVPADDDRAAHPPGRRQSARRRAPAADVRVRARGPGRSRPAATTSATSAPDFALRLTTDASLTAILEERPFFVEDAVTLLLGRRRADCGPPPALGRHFVEETHRALARMGARPRDSVRMAGGRHPRGDHAEAQRVRRHGRDRRRDDDVDSGGARIRPQLGLSLLLAARRVLRRQCAEPARRDDDDGALPPATSSASPPARATGRSSPSTRIERRRGTARADRERAARAIAAWARCASATTRGGRSSTTSTARPCSRPRTCSSTSA